MASRAKRRGIQTKILWRTMIIGVLPLLVIGGASVAILGSLANEADTELRASRAELVADVAADQIQGSATDLGQAVEVFLGERADDVTTWASTAELVDAAVAGAQLAEEQGLTELDAETLESRFAGDPRLVPSSDAQRFLDRALELTDDGVGFALVAFTDEHGFTIGATDRPAAFTNADQDWWQAAWEEGSATSDVTTDPMSGEPSLILASRIDSAAGSPVGVVAATLPLSSLDPLVAEWSATHDLAVAVVDADDTALVSGSREGTDTPTLGSIEQASTGETDAVTSDAGTGAGYAIDLDPEGDVVGYSGLANGWTVVVAQPRAEALAPLAGIETLRFDLSETANDFSVLLLVLIGASLIAAYLVARLLARNIVQPLLELRESAQQVADIELPRMVMAVNRLEEGEELPPVTIIDVRTDDEIEDVADAFTSVQDTAVRLAAEQASSRRRNIAAAFVSMGRRNQNLIGRQLRFIEQLERDESDPATLANLFRLDHLATRMRRNAESLLVLAGEEPPRQWSEPVRLVDVVRSAAAEIEDFQRVEISSMDDAELTGSAVSEMSHLLAELIENAISYSPPASTVTVLGRRGDDGYTLSIVDAGIGLEADDLAEANERLARPAELDQAPTQRLGLFVVGRLAARLGVGVRLVANADQGVTAVVSLPEAMLAEPVADGADATTPPEPAASPSPAVVDHADRSAGPPAPAPVTPAIGADPATGSGPTPAFSFERPAPTGGPAPAPAPPPAASGPAAPLPTRASAASRPASGGARPAAIDVRARVATDPATIPPASPTPHVSAIPSPAGPTATPDPAPPVGGPTPTPAPAPTPAPSLGERSIPDVPTPDDPTAAEPRPTGPAATTGPADAPRPEGAPALPRRESRLTEQVGDRPDARQPVRPRPGEPRRWEPSEAAAALRRRRPAEAPAPTLPPAPSTASPLGVPRRQSTLGATSTPAPTRQAGPGGDGSTTPSGFRRRVPGSVPAPTTDRPTQRAPRDAAAVRATLSRYMDGVRRGQSSDDVPTAPDATPAGGTP